MSEEIVRDKKDRLAYWATIENYRWWLASDQIFLQLIAHEKTISAHTVRTIAKAYGINRNINADEDKKTDRTATAIAEVLNTPAIFDEIKSLDTLEDKFSAFRAILKQMPMNKGRDDDKLIFVSGTSKLVWFYAPQAWTLFDRLAAHGAKIPKSLSSIERAKQFYTALTKRGFERTVAKVQPILDNSPIRFQSAERLIDKYLWLAGCDLKARDHAVLMLRFYMNGLPPETKTHLEKLAMAIADACETDLKALTKK